MRYGEGGGRGFRIGNPYISAADSCWCMAKPIQYCKVKKNTNINWTSPNKNILRFGGLEYIPMFNISVDSRSLSQLSSSCSSFLLIVSFSLSGHICADNAIMQIVYFYLYSLWLSAKCPVAQLRTGDSWWFLLVLEMSCLQACL